MLHRLIFLLVLALVATPAVAMVGDLRCAKMAISADVAADTIGLASATDPAGGQELPGGGAVHGGKSHCLHGLATPRAGAVAARGGASNRLRWTDLQSSPTEVHRSPALPPPVSTA